ncbi:MAG: hypothetical protein ACK5XB_09100, partial [Rhodospirillales bacterium]
MIRKLFSQFKIGGLELPNRIVIAPMCQYSADNGDASDWHTVHLSNMLLSGAGLMILEATAVEEIGRITHGCLGLYSDANEASLDLTGFSWARLIEIISLERNPGRCPENDIAPSRSSRSCGRSKCLWRK